MVKFAWLCSHESYQPEDLVEQAVLAEQAGFDTVLGSDHFHPWVDDTSAAGFVWSWLGTVAARTERVELGTSVTCPLFHYHPGLVAQASATVQRLSGGRLLLGVGSGEAINETPLGWEFPGYGERMGRMREALEIIRRLHAGEKLDFAGDHYTTTTAKLYSPPTAPVPTLLAAGGPKSAAFAGAHADGLITSVKNPQDTITKVIEPFRAAAAERGNPDPRILATRWTVLAGDDEEAWRALGPMRGLRAPGRLEAADPAVLRERADAMDRSEVLGSYTVVPDADALVEAYRPLVEQIDAEWVSIQVASNDPVGTIKLIGENVLPRLRELAA
ncbi:TIGR03557 family F420-dependent LLM class oxidoreductase [Jiangella muralis]|uniref:TIGR03557 family F420-dependent LLM class oxidoreductase n=1 Tax=Jiangella muralis TaxID=702383 RepID=UPI00069DDDE8|nr:TIGR03557 family F420-dependent LLM class oxidoreductase [Jiangella muralis]